MGSSFSKSTQKKITERSMFFIFHVLYLSSIHTLLLTGPFLFRPGTHNCWETVIGIDVYFLQDDILQCILSFQILHSFHPLFFNYLWTLTKLYRHLCCFFLASCEFVSLCIHWFSLEKKDVLINAERIKCLKDMHFWYPKLNMKPSLLVWSHSS